MRCHSGNIKNTKGEEREMSNKDSILLEHNNLLLIASDVRSTYCEFINADDENIMAKSEVYESRLNDLKKAILSLIEKSPSGG